MADPYFHKLLLPKDLLGLQWKRVVIGAEQLLQKTFFTKNADNFGELITLVDELELTLGHLATVVADEEQYTVTVRLTTHKYKVPTIIDFLFARRLEARYLNSQLKGEERPFLFIDFDGTVRCVVQTPDDEKGKLARAPIECEEVEVFPQVREILQKARNEGYTIIGVTNQSGITRRGIPKEKIEACIEETKRQIGLEFPVYFSQDRGALYKPQIGMGIEAITEHGPMDFSESLMVGDNHRGGDWGFAEGMGIRFEWAQDYFNLTDEQIACSTVPKQASLKGRTQEDSHAETEPPLKGETTEAPYEVKVYVPSTRLDEEIPKEEYRERIKETQAFLADLFGGYTSLGAKGGYVSDVEGLISEPVVLVTCWAARQAYEDNLPRLEEFLKAKREEWGQEVIGFEFENDFFMFPEYQESSAEFFLAETVDNASWYDEAENGIKSWINTMLTLRNKTVEVDGEVVFKGWGSAEDHAIAADYEKWLFENCERFDVERGEYFTCTMRHKAEMKQCYHNSLMYSWEDSDSQYYEGWVVTDGLSMPIRHAWIVKDGQVFDPTFDVLREQYGRKRDERICYYGVEIPEMFILRYISAFEISGPFLFDYYFSLKEEYAHRRDGFILKQTPENRTLQAITNSFMGESVDRQHIHRLN